MFCYGLAGGGGGMARGVMALKRCVTLEKGDELATCP